MKLESSRHIFEKYSNIKFHENPSSGSQVAPCRRMDGQTEVRKLIIAFYNFSESSKKLWCQKPQVVQVDHVEPRCRRL